MHLYKGKGVYLCSDSLKVMPTIFHPLSNGSMMRTYLLKWWKFKAPMDLFIFLGKLKRATFEYLFVFFRGSGGGGAMFALDGDGFIYKKILLRIVSSLVSGIRSRSPFGTARGCLSHRFPPLAIFFPQFMNVNMVTPRRRLLTRGQPAS